MLDNFTHLSLPFNGLKMQARTFQMVILSCFFSSEEFLKYCEDVSETAAWGGQLEVAIF